MQSDGQSPEEPYLYGITNSHAIYTPTVPRGITRIDGIGEYTGDPVHVFYILYSKYEISSLRAIISKYDPHAFIVAKDGAVIYGNYKKKI